MPADPDHDRELFELAGIAALLRASEPLPTPPPDLARRVREAIELRSLRDRG